MTTPLRTLFINHSVRDGGPGRSLFYILKYIDKAKITPFVLVPREDVFTELVKKEGLGDKEIELSLRKGFLKTYLDLGSTQTGLVKHHG